MRILFTHTNLPLSKVIMAASKEPCSHVALEFPTLGIVVQSNLLGVNIVWAKYFRAHETIVAEIERDTTIQDISRIDNLLTKYDGAPYDVGALLFGLLLLFVSRWLPFLKKPKKNPWAISGTFMCTEWVTDEIEGFEDAMITPWQLYQQLKASGQWTDVTGK